MRVAIIHDWLITFGGAERVLEQLLLVFPEADVFTLLDYLPASSRGFLSSHRVTTSFLQGLPLSRRRYRHYLPLMPLAVEQFDLTGYDIVISSTHSVAQGVLTAPGQVNLAYVNRTMRYAWDRYHADLREFGLGSGIRSWAARLAYHRLRQWDWLSYQRPHTIVANSHFVARRMRRVYGRSSQVIYPPVDVEKFQPRRAEREAYLYAGRLAPYKRVDLLVEACTRIGVPLRIAGDGPSRGELQRRAGPRVEFLGWQSAKQLAELLPRSLAFLMPGAEEFGIAAIEAQACGIPVIAFAGGAAAETIGHAGEAPTGVLFEQQTSECLEQALRRFAGQREAFSARACRSNAERFSPQRFRQQIEGLVKGLSWDWRRDGEPAAGMAAGFAGPV